MSRSLDWLAWLGLARLASAWLVSSAAATRTATTPEQADKTIGAALRAAAMVVDACSEVVSVAVAAAALLSRVLNFVLGCIVRCLLAGVLTCVLGCALNCGLWLSHRRARAGRRLPERHAAVRAAERK